ncbi:glycosyltransferase family 2 protein [Marinomonas posidonica]|uniref:glycosyltransferase family 2 protein n=1 Tax=Marinomonas posidonica TaxID=936476 RepID=UPI003736719A
MKQGVPLVSVAIISYNQKNYLRECIESCLAQDYSNFEIVIADDSSTDGTQNMLCEYKARYPNKFVLRLAEKNQGITLNSNEAHFACSGKYIAWMGGDDIMLPGKLTKQVEYMENNPDCAICYHNLDVFNSETGKTLYFFNDKFKLSGDIKTAIRYGSFNGACSNLVRACKAPKHGFDKSLVVASDWLYWVETLASGGTINYLDEVLGRYRRHKNNITNKSDCITQGDIDHLNSCNIIFFKYPEYYDCTRLILSERMWHLRKKDKSYNTVFMAMRLDVKLKYIISALVFYFSFSKIKI